MNALTDIFKKVVMKDLKGDRSSKLRRSRRECKRLNESNSMTIRGNSFSAEESKFKPNSKMGLDHSYSNVGLSQSVSMQDLHL